MFPKICTHRHDASAQVVVANQEQYDALPEEYRTAAASGDTGVAVDTALLHDEVLAKLAADRAQLDKDRLAFSEDLEKAKDELRAERADIDALRSQLELDKAELEKTRAGVAPTDLLTNAEEAPKTVRKPRTAPAEQEG